MKKGGTFITIVSFAFLCVSIIYLTTLPQVQSKLNKSFAPALSTPAALIASTPQVTATNTLVPTPTTDYAATSSAAQAQIKSAQDEAQAAQALANSAQGTANALLQSQIQVTQQAQQIELQKIQNAQQIAQWTKDAPATPTPNATATVEKIIAINGASTAISVNATTIAEAPTQIVRSAIAQDYAKNVNTYHWLDIVMPRIDAILIVAVVVIITIIIIVGLQQPAKEETEPITETAALQWAPEARQIITPIKVASATGNENWLYQVPCEPEAFFEFCNGVINEHISLAYNNWEGAQSPLTRKDKNSFRSIRNFLLANRFAKSSDSTKTLILTAEGEQFMRAYLDDGNLPHSYSFNPDFKHETAEDAHMSEAHGHEEAVGEVVTPISALIPMPQVKK